MIIWITGLSGSGKTTLGNALWKLLKPHVPELVLLDGDAIRAAFGHDLGYREEDRTIQIKRLQNIAKLLTEQGLIVIVTALYAHPELLRWNRQHLCNYFEVYLEVSLDTVYRRDSKGLYAGVATGEIKHVVGIDIPWHTPKSPDLVINTDYPEKPEVLAQQVVAAIPHLAQVLEGT